MKKLNRFLCLGLMLASPFFLLSGCVQVKNGKPTGNGWVYQFLVSPMGNIIKYFANDVGIGFGLSIILVTILVFTCIFPLSLYQSYHTTYQTEKRNYLKPILSPLQERVQKAQTQEEKLSAQQALLTAQKENGINPFGGVGCLPFLIQMPFFSSLFYASRFTEGISESNFLGISLGRPSLFLIAIVGSLYFIQSALTLMGMDKIQRQQMQGTMFLSPLMIIFFSFSSPAGVTLYWFVGGIVAIIQQLLIIYFIRPTLRKKVAKEFETNPPKNPKTSEDDKSNSSYIATHKNRRNAGRQRSR